MHVFEWHEVFSKGREVGENLRRPNTTPLRHQKVKKIVHDNLTNGSTQLILVDVLGMNHIVL